MEPLGRRILYFCKAPASTPQGPFTRTPADCLNCLFTMLSIKLLIGPIVSHLQKLDRKKMWGAGFSTRAPHDKLLETTSQLPQSRAVSLVMVQPAPSEQLTTW